MSRAALARRFHELVGEPPMTFLTGWRMAIAADLLLEPGVTVGQAAERVGYGSPFTFSTAFKRHFGQSPRAYRDAAPHVGGRCRAEGCRDTGGGSGVVSGRDRVARRDRAEVRAG